MFKQVTPSIPPHRIRRGRSHHACLAAIALYVLICGGLLFVLAARDTSITIGSNSSGGTAHALEQIAAGGGNSNSGYVGIVDNPHKFLPETVTGYDAVAPACIAIGAKCRRRANALRWARAQQVSAEIVAAVKSAAARTDIPVHVLLAIGHVESGNDQTPAGYCDNGMAIGWGQVHRSPWQLWASDELGRQVDLDNLRDNVLISAMVLEYSGYHEDPLTAYARYNGGPNPNYSYAREVAARVREIGGMK